MPPLSVVAPTLAVPVRAPPPLIWTLLEAIEPVTDSDPLCSRCWQAAGCPRQFSFPPSDHESLFGLLPLSTQVAQRLLRQVRPWIEPCQSYEKNQLGLSKIFLNSLRLTWCMSLLADAAVILRALVLTRRPSIEKPLAAIMPRQMNLELD